MFEKGKSGNPNGRPTKKESLTEILKEIGEKERIDFNGKTIFWKEAISYKLWNMALKGDKAAIVEIFNRIDGKPKEKIEHSGSFFDNIINTENMTEEEVELAYQKQVANLKK